MVKEFYEKLLGEYGASNLLKIGFFVVIGAGIGGIIGTLTIDKNEETTNYEKESIDHE